MGPQKNAKERTNKNGGKTEMCVKDEYENERQRRITTRLEKEVCLSSTF